MVSGLVASCYRTFSVIGAIAAGRTAAVSIDKYLGGKGIIDEKLTRSRRIIAPANEEFPGKARVAMPMLSPGQRAREF